MDKATKLISVNDRDFDPEYCSIEVRCKSEEAISDLAAYLKDLGYGYEGGTGEAGCEIFNKEKFYYDNNKPKFLKEIKADIKNWKGVA